MISRRLLRIKVLKSLYAHLKSESDSLMGSEKTLVASIDKTYDLYFQMMSLIVAMPRLDRRLPSRRNSLHSRT